MKKIYVLLLGIISALCLTATAAFAFQPVVKADGEPTSEPAYAEYLSETKIKVSNDLSKLIAITAVKNVEVVYELGYTLDGATTVSGETNKYYTSITTGGVTQTVAELFGEGYDGMIIWEATYSAATGASVTPYVKIGVIVEGGLDITNPVTVTGATKTTKLTVKFGEDEQEVNFGAELTVPEDPALENYTFLGWKNGTDTDVYDFTAENAKTVVKSLTFTAAYKPVISFTAPVNSLTVGEKINLTAPATSASEQLTVTAQIRLRGTDTWADVALTDGAAQYTTETLGMHEVKYVASYEGGSEEKVYNVWVRDKNVIADFELVGEDSYHGWISPREEGFVGSIVSDETVISGDHSILIGSGSDSWTVFNYDSSNAGVDLTGYTDIIEFWATASNDINGYAVGIYNGGWLEPTVNIKAGTHKYVVTYPREFNRIDKLEFQNGNRWNTTVRIDDVKAVVLFGSIPTGYTVGAETQVNFPASGVTNESAQIRKVGAETWTDVAVADNKMNIKLTEAGSYEIKVTATQNETEYTKTYKVIGRDKNVIADYELNADGTYHGQVTPVSATLFTGTIVTENVGDGANALKISPNNDAWAEYNFEANGGSAVSLTGYTDTIEFWVYSPKDIPVATTDYCWIIEIHDGLGWQSAKIAITTGLHKYTATFSRAFNKVTKYGFRANNTTGWFYVDGIKAIVPFDNIPTNYALNVEQAVKFPATGVTNESAQIRKVGTEDWTELAVADNKMDIKLTEAGDYEVRVNATISGVEFTRTYVVNAKGSDKLFNYEQNADGTFDGFDLAHRISSWGTTFSIDNTWAKDGSYSLKVVGTGNGWDGFNLAAAGTTVTLAEETDTLEMWINANSAVTGWQCEVSAGGGWIGHTPINLVAGESRYVIKFNSKFSQITKFEFESKAGRTFRIDAVRAVYEGVKQDLLAIQTAYAVGSEQSVAFPLNNATNPTATLVKASDSSAVATTIADGVVKFTLPAAGDYELTLSCDESNARTYKILGRAANSLCFGDFELDASGNYHGYGSHYGNAMGNVADCVSDDWSADGSYSWKFGSTIGSAWYGFEAFRLDIPDVSAVTKVCVWIKAPSAINGFQLWFVTDNGSVYAKKDGANASITVPAGVSRVELDITLPAGATKLTAFEFAYSGSLCGGSPVYFDGFTFE